MRALDPEKMIRSSAHAPPRPRQPLQKRSHKPPMPTFLRSSNVYTSILNSIHDDAQTHLRLIDGTNHHRTFVAFVLLLLLVIGTSARATGSNNSFNLIAPVAAISSLSKPDKKRILMLRRNESLDGARFRVMSDSPLDDYKSFMEGERVCVMIPQAAFVSTRNETNGRGFTEMRIEQRDDDVVFSFRLQQGATVAVNQHFNRLDVVFITNERANSKGLK
jgi:hypothetical protein